MDNDFEYMGYRGVSPTGGFVSTSNFNTPVLANEKCSVWGAKADSNAYALRKALQVSKEMYHEVLVDQCNDLLGDCDIQGDRYVPQKISLPIDISFNDGATKIMQQMVKDFAPFENIIDKLIDPAVKFLPEMIL